METRRKVLKMVPVSLLGSQLAFTQTPAAKPFIIAIPKGTIDHILTRVRQANWPPKLDAPDWRYGVNFDYMRSLAEYWTTRFDWKKAETKLNRYPQFLARVEDFDIHFYHVKGKGERTLPVIFTHGWPGSVFEFQEAIGPLTEAGLDVVVPSLPGFGFSSKPAGKPVGPITTARLWHKLMTEVLGYQKFGAQGGDWGNAVTVQLAREFPNSLIGIHLNATGGAAPATGQLTGEVIAWQKAAAAHRTQELDYFNEQQHKPQTVAFALSDSPLGFAAWIIEKFKVWSDSGTDIEKAFTKDQLLTNVMIYLVTGTTATGVWFYRGAAEEPSTLRGKVTVPTGFASFPGEMPSLNPPRSVLEANFNLVQYNKMPRGGHFACLEQPGLFVEEVTKFFGRFK